MSYKDRVGFERRNIILPPKQVTTVDYSVNSPNYFMVYNHAVTNVYCGVSHTPTQNAYDFMVGGQKYKMYAEPNEKRALYLFNPTDSEVRITIQSFRWDFEPVALAMSMMEIDLTGQTMEASSVISGFNVPLPAGNNTIGKVNLAEETNSDLAEALSAIYGAHIDTNSKLDSILSAINGLTNYKGFVTVTEV